MNKWVENIGTNLINQAKLYIDTNEVNSLSGKFMNVLSEMNHDDSKKKIYDEMIGNVPEIYDPCVDRDYKNKNFIPILCNAGTNYSDSYNNTPDENNIYYTNVDRILDRHTHFSLKQNGGAVTDVDIIPKDKKQIIDHYKTCIGHQNDIWVTYINDTRSDNNATVLTLESNYPHIFGGTLTSETQHKQFYHKEQDFLPANDSIIKTIEKNSVFRAGNKSSYIPSIRKKKCRVPLPFYFSKNPGLALPLISLQKSEVKVDLILNPVKIYTQF